MQSKLKSEYQKRIELFQKTLLKTYLSYYQGNIAKIEKEKGFPRCTIYRLIKKHKIDLESFRNRKPIKFVSI